MPRLWLITLLCILPGLTAGSLSCQSGPQEKGLISQEGMRTQFSLADTHQFLFLPGEVVPMIFTLINNGDAPLTELSVSIKAPEGTISRDTFWKKSDSDLVRIIPNLSPGERVDLSYQALIKTDFKGTTLLFTAKLAGSDSSRTVQVEVARVIASKPDTCAYFQDSTAAGINTFVSTRDLLMVNLKEPIMLSPKAPVLISPKKCAAFALKPLKKKKKPEKIKCSCLVYNFVGPTGRNYPKIFKPNGKRLIGQETITSGSRAGDTVTISIRTLDQSSLRNILLTDGRNELLNAVVDSPVFEYEHVLTEDTLRLQLYLRSNRKFFIFPVKQYAFIEVKRKPSSIQVIRSPDRPARRISNSTKILASGKIGQDGDLTVISETLVQKTPEGSIFYVIEKTQDSTGFVLQQDTINSDTCVGSYQVKRLESKQLIKTWKSVDTLMTTAQEEEYQVVGRRNIMGIRQGAAEIKIPYHLNAVDEPATDTLIAIAYWIGIGESPISTYETLAEEVPDEWTQPGVSAPLAAYGLGHPVLLPQLAAGESIFQKEMVAYDFVALRGKKAFANGSGSYAKLVDRQSTRPNYGVVAGAALDRLLGTLQFDKELNKEVIQFYFVYAGRHEINSYRIQLKLVAYYEVSEPRKIWQILTPAQP